MFPSIALTKDQDPSAVRIKIIYDKYKEFGEKSIPFVKEYTTIDKTNQVWQINTKTFSIKDIEISDQRAIKEVIDKFKDWPIQELNNIIKNQTPYAVAVKKYYHCKKPIPISNDSIKNFFP